MKKTVAGIIVSFLLSGVLVGCGFVPVKIQEGSINENYSDTETVEKNEQEASSSQDSEGIVLYVAKLPKQYFITYEVANEDGVIETISKAVDKEGNIYYKADEEYLFLRDGENFILYQREGQKFVEQTDKKYQSSYVENLTGEFEDYVKKANLNTGGITKLVGEEEIVGRQCKVYEITVKIVNFEQNFQFAIDQETCICLSWESVKNISGYEEAGEENFRCIRFDTENINLEEELIGN